MTQAERIILTAPSGLIEAEIALPSSKSESNRALIISALGGFCQPRNIADCDDTRAVRNALANIGSTTIDIGAAGTAMRFLTAFFAIHAGQRTLTGSTRMLQRPIGQLVEALRQLGANIEYTEREGFPPLLITGREIKGGSVEIDGGTSSQFISALLMIGPMLTGGLLLRLTGTVRSRPYIDMTLRLMQRYGAVAGWTSSDTIKVEHSPYREADFCVEADWSAASYWYETMAFAPIGSAVRLYGLKKQSIQGDSAVAKLFQRLSVSTEYCADEPCSVIIKKTATVNNTDLFEADLSDCPDLAQSLIVACAMLNVPFCFSGLESLAIKETDRGAALKAELKKMGVEITVAGGRISMEKQSQQPHSATILTYDDHRMAMAFAPAAIIVGPMTIENPSVTSKSYPTFWRDLEKARFQITNR